MAEYTTGHCPNHNQPGGCQLHNLQCGWPNCDRRQVQHQPPSAASVSERARHGVVRATVRATDEDDVLHIECRFDDGQKYAAIETSGHRCEELAGFIVSALEQALTQQRGECWPLNKNPKDGWTFDPSFLDEVKTRAEQSDIGEFAPCLEGVESVLIALRGMGDTTTPQPAAADGGVRERAREILKSEMGGFGTDDQGRVPLEYALRAVATAPSSHRQAGDGDEDVESAARALFEAQADPHAAPWDHQWDRTKQYWRRVARANLHTAPPPGAGLSKFRELAEKWLAEDARRHSAPTELSGCADELLALVEKGGGNGR